MILNYRILHIISVIVFTATLFSCSSEDSVSSAEREMTLECFVDDDTLSTRAIKESSYFSASDDIGVWAFNDDGSQYGNNKNVWVRYNGSVWRFHDPIVLNANNANIYASYPWSEAGDSAGVGTIPVYPGTTDYMWGESISSCNCENTRGILRFHHALARLKFRFKLTNDSDPKGDLHAYINYLALNDDDSGSDVLVNKGIMDVRTGSIEPAVTGETVEYILGFPLSKTSYHEVDLLVIPCSLTSETVYLNFSLNGDYKQMELKGDTWEAGETYTYDVNIHLTRWNEETQSPILPESDDEKDLREWDVVQHFNIAESSKTIELFPYWSKYSRLSTIKKMEVDGQVVTPTSTVSFSEGEHVVKFNINSTQLEAYYMQSINSVTTSMSGGSVTSFYPKEHHPGMYKVLVGGHITSLANAFEVQSTSVSQLEKVILGQTVTKIGDRAFYGCSGIKNIKINETIEKIGYHSFIECNNLVEIEYNAINATFTSDGSYTNDGAFSKSVNKIKIGNSVKSIPDYFANGLMNLTSIVIPKSVTKIGFEAFNRCSSLSTIYAYPSSAPTLSASFYGIKSNGTLYYPAGADYSTWMQNKDGYLGYKKWSSSQMTQ